MNMKVAIPYWQGRVSPVFDVAQNLQLVDVENGREIMRAKRTLKNSDSFNRAQHILQFDVKLVICCAISEPFEVSLQSAGVGVISNVCGPIEDVLKAFLNGTLADSDLFMPGFNNRRRRHRKRRGR